MTPTREKCFIQNGLIEKKAIEWATEYITALRNVGNNADFEIKTM